MSPPPNNKASLTYDYSLDRARFASPWRHGIAAAYNAVHTGSSEAARFGSVVVRRRADVREHDGEDDEAVPRRQHDERKEQLEEHLT